MKRQSVVVGGLVALSLASATANAGHRVVSQVNISAYYKFAYGNLGDARNSADVNQDLGCTTSAYSDGSIFVTCQANDQNGNWAFCSSSNPAMVAAAQSIGSDSYVYFSWDANYSCTAIQVENNSWTTPKNP